MKSRGMSPVMATIALILLTITAAGIIAGFVVPYVKNNLHSSTECIDYKEYFSFYNGFDYNCYVSSGGTWIYGVSVSADFVCQEADSECEEIINEVDGFTLKLARGSESQPSTVKIGSPANRNTDGIRMLNLSETELEVPKSGEVRTYIYNSSQKYDSIEIYPLLKSGRVCDKTDSIRAGDKICTQSLFIS